MTLDEKARLIQLAKKLRAIAAKDPYYSLDIMEVAVALDRLRSNARPSSFFAGLSVADALEQLTATERSNVMSQIHQLYCKHCWEKLKESEICHCQNDRW